MAFVSVKLKGNKMAKKKSSTSLKKRYEFSALELLLLLVLFAVIGGLTVHYVWAGAWGS
jgi:hypothetical protein